MMEVFLDTSSLQTIEELSWIIDGVTTNPSLVAKEGLDMKTALAEISKLVNGPISIEVVSDSFSDMLKEADSYASMSDNAVIKLPITIDGLRACKALSRNGVPTNMTLCFSAAQAVLAAKCGATYVSPFVGRIDDIGYSGLSLIHEIRTIFDNGFSTKILAASIRNLEHVTECAKIGVDAMTLPDKILRSMVSHPLTDAGLARFKADYEKLISKF